MAFGAMFSSYAGDAFVRLEPAYVYVHAFSTSCQEFRAQTAGRFRLAFCGELVAAARIRGFLDRTVRGRGLSGTFAVFLLLVLSAS